MGEGLRDPPKGSGGPGGSGATALQALPLAPSTGALPGAVAPALCRPWGPRRFPGCSCNALARSRRSPLTAPLRVQRRRAAAMSAGPAGHAGTVRDYSSRERSRQRTTAPGIPRAVTAPPRPAILPPRGDSPSPLQRVPPQRPLRTQMRARGRVPAAQSIPKPGGMRVSVSHIPAHPESHGDRPRRVRVPPALCTPRSVSVQEPQTPPHTTGGSQAESGGSRRGEGTLLAPSQRHPSPGVTQG